MTNEAKAPLTGVKVVELARILAGPWTGQTLADLGADVLKIESPQGDDTRGWGPPFLELADGSLEAAYFHSANRGKRSACVDLSDAQQLAQLIDLIKEADVFIENFKVGGLTKYGLDYSSLQAINPKLIYCSITGFGQTGPDAQKPGYDFIIQGLSGIMDLTGDVDGPPQKMGVAFADVFTGLYAVIGIQAALRQRQETGLGQQLDLSLLDCMMAVQANQNMNYLVSGESPTRMGNAHPNISPYEVIPTSDGWLILAVGNDAQFKRCCEVLELTDLSQDPRFLNNALRLTNREALTAVIQSKSQTWTKENLQQALEQAKVPVGPINSVEEAFANPQVQARQLVSHLIREDGLKVPTVNLPVKFSNNAETTSKPAPALGSDNLTWL